MVVEDPQYKSFALTVKDTQSKKLLRSLLAKKQDNKCAYCGIRLFDCESSLNKKTPKCKGGNNSKENFLLVCEMCREEKEDMTEQEFRDHLYEVWGIRYRIKPKKNSYKTHYPYCEVEDIVERLMEHQLMFTACVPLVTVKDEKDGFGELNFIFPEHPGFPLRYKVYVGSNKNFYKLLMRAIDAAHKTYEQVKKMKAEELECQKKT